MSQFNGYFHPDNHSDNLKLVMPTDHLTTTSNMDYAKSVTANKLSYSYYPDHHDHFYDSDCGSAALTEPTLNDLELPDPFFNSDCASPVFTEATSDFENVYPPLYSPVLQCYVGRNAPTVSTNDVTQVKGPTFFDGEFFYDSEEEAVVGEGHNDDDDAKVKPVAHDNHGEPVVFFENEDIQFDPAVLFDDSQDDSVLFGEEDKAYGGDGANGTTVFVDYTDDDYDVYDDYGNYDDYDDYDEASDDDQASFQEIVGGGTGEEEDGFGFAAASFETADSASCDLFPTAGSPIPYKKDIVDEDGPPLDPLMARILGETSSPLTVLGDDDFQDSSDLEEVDEEYQSGEDADSPEEVEAPVDGNDDDEAAEEEDESEPMEEDEPSPTAYALGGRKRKAKTSYADSDDDDLLPAPKTKRRKQQKKAAPKKRKTATNDKPFVCSICGHASKRRYNLNTHMKTHNKDRVKEFPCTECDKAFDRKHDRDRHVLTVHEGRRAHECNLCHAQFSRGDALARHMEKHDAE